jgi:hypothetical protein
MGIKRILGLFLAIVSAASLLATVFAVVQVWRQYGKVQANLDSGIGLISATLQTTSDGLTIAGQSLDSLQASVITLESTMDTLDQSLEDSDPMLETLSSLVGDDLPVAVSSTQASLRTAQESAKIIDAVLRFLTILSPSMYRPAVPLDVALGQVSKSLDGLPQSFETMETSLSDVQSNMMVVRVQLSLISDQILQTRLSLEAAQQVVTQYETLVSQMDSGVASLHKRLPRWMNSAAWICTFVLFWLGLTQLSWLQTSWRMTRVGN